MFLMIYFVSLLVRTPHQLSYVINSPTQTLLGLMFRLSCYFIKLDGFLELGLLSNPIVVPIFFWTWLKPLVDLVLLPFFLYRNSFVVQQGSLAVVDTVLVTFGILTIIEREGLPPTEELKYTWCSSGLFKLA